MIDASCCLFKQKSITMHGNMNVKFLWVPVPMWTFANKVLYLYQKTRRRRETEKRINIYVDTIIRKLCSDLRTTFFTRIKGLI